MSGRLGVWQIPGRHGLPRILKAPKTAKKKIWYCVYDFTFATRVAVYCTAFCRPAQIAGPTLHITKCNSLWFCWHHLSI